MGYNENFCTDSKIVSCEEGVTAKYYKTILLKNGTECCLRNGTESDGQLVLDNFNLTHEQTDYLLPYPDENSFDVVQESRFLKEKSESDNEIEILAVVNNDVVGTAGYVQLELNVVSDNTRAISMYEKAGFQEYGRNPKGFHSRITGFQEVVYMRLEL